MNVQSERGILEGIFLKAALEIHTQTSKCETTVVKLTNSLPAASVSAPRLPWTCLYSPLPEDDPAALWSQRQKTFSGLPDTVGEITWQTKHNRLTRYTNTGFHSQTAASFHLLNGPDAQRCVIRTRTLVSDHSKFCFTLFMLSQASICFSANPNISFPLWSVFTKTL